MDIDFINKLAKVLQENNMQELEYSSNNEKIILIRNKELKASEKEINFKYQNNHEFLNQEKTDNFTGKKEDFKNNISLNDEINNIEKINSNMIGTFYRKPSPSDEEFVNIGSKVKKGDVVGIIESMKLLNEIKAPFDCEILNVLADDEEVVEFGQALFEVRVM